MLKYVVIRLGKRATRSDWQYKQRSNSIRVTEKEKDLGVIINNRSSLADHISGIVRSINNLLVSNM